MQGIKFTSISVTYSSNDRSCKKKGLALYWSLFRLTSSYPTYPHFLSAFEKTQAIRTIYPHLHDAQVIRISIPLKLSTLPIRT